MTDKELFIECVKRLGRYGIELRDDIVYSDCRQSEGNAEFCIKGYNLGFNLYRLGEVLAVKADFS